jgi:hypothetical protein
MNNTKHKFCNIGLRLLHIVKEDNYSGLRILEYFSRSLWMACGCLWFLYSYISVDHDECGRAAVGLDGSGRADCV